MLHEPNVVLELSVKWLIIKYLYNDRAIVGYVEGEMLRTTINNSK